MERQRRRLGGGGLAHTSALGSYFWTQNQLLQVAKEGCRCHFNSHEGPMKFYFSSSSFFFFLLVESRFITRGILAYEEEEIISFI